MTGLGDRWVGSFPSHRYSTPLLPRLSSSSYFYSFSSSSPSPRLCMGGNRSWEKYQSCVVIVRKMCLPRVSTSFTIAVLTLSARRIVAPASLPFARFFSVEIYFGLRYFGIFLFSRLKGGKEVENLVENVFFTRSVKCLSPFNHLLQTWKTFSAPFLFFLKFLYFLTL